MYELRNRLTNGIFCILCASASAITRAKSVNEVKQCIELLDIGGWAAYMPALHISMFSILEKHIDKMYFQTKRQSHDISTSELD